MASYTVEIDCTVKALVTVDADSPEEAETKAREDFPGLISYAGNGGWDKLCGTEAHNVSLDPDCGFEVVDIEEA